MNGRSFSISPARPFHLDLLVERLFDIPPPRVNEGDRAGRDGELGSYERELAAGLVIAVNADVTVKLAALRLAGSVVTHEGTPEPLVA